MSKKIEYINPDKFKHWKKIKKKKKKKKRNGDSK